MMLPILCSGRWRAEHHHNSLFASAALAALVLAGCSSDSSQVVFDLQGFYSRAQLDGAAIDYVGIKVDGPGLEAAPLLAEVNRDTMTFELAVPSGPARRFSVDAWRLAEGGEDVPVYIGQTVLDLTPGNTYDITIPAWPVGVLDAAVLAPDGTALPDGLEVVFASEQPIPGINNPLTLPVLGGRVLALLGVGLHEVTASFELDGATYAVPQLTKLAVGHGELSFPNIYLIQPGTRCRSDFPADLRAESPACRNMTAQVSGLLGTGLVLSNGPSTLAVTQDGEHLFGMGLAEGENYAVTVVTQPTSPAQDCVVDEVLDNGQVGQADLVVPVTCTTRTYPVSVNVVGLTGWGLQVSDGEQTLDVESDGTYTFAAPRADSSTYTVSIATQPTGETSQPWCEIDTPTGTMLGPVTVTVYCVGGVEPLYYVGANWNDWVSVNPEQPYAPYYGPCSGMAKAGYYDTCVHGAERRAIIAGFLTSCAGVSATDELGAFEWVCDDQPIPMGKAGKALSDVRLISLRLKSDQSLSSLLDFSTLAWRPNRVTITDGTHTWHTASGVWWQNPVVEVTNANQQLQGGDPGTVYVVAANVTGTQGGGLVAQGDKTSLVVAPGAKLSAFPAFLSSYKSFLWLEGSFASNGMGTSGAVIQLMGPLKAVLRNVTVENSGETGIHISSGEACELKNVVATGNMAVGIRLEGGTETKADGLTASGTVNGTGVVLAMETGGVFKDIRVFDNSQQGLSLSSNYDNQFSTIYAYDNVGDGIEINGSYNTISSIYAHGNGGSGVVLSSGGNNNTLAGAQIYANGGDGLQVFQSGAIVTDAVIAANLGGGFVNSSMYTSNDSRIRHLMAFDNGADGLRLSGQNDVFADITSANNGSTGLQLESLSNSVLLGVTAANNGPFEGGSGINMTSSSNNLILSSTVINSYTGIEVPFFTYSWNNRIINVGIFGSTGFGLNLDDPSSNTDISGAVITGGNAGGDCYEAPAKASGCGGFTGATTGAAASQLVGPVTTNDSQNLADTSTSPGVAPYNSIADTNWVTFDSPYRAWGQDAAEAFPADTHRGACATGETCRIYDWRTRTGAAITGAVAVPTAADATQYKPNITLGGTPASHEDCDAMYHAGSILVSPGACALEILPNAMERPDSDTVDGDLLCEANEDCIYFGNLGSYQGEGALTQIGVVTLTRGNATLYGYATTGVTP